MNERRLWDDANLRWRDWSKLFHRGLRRSRVREGSIVCCVLSDARSRNLSPRISPTPPWAFRGPQRGPARIIPQRGCGTLRGLRGWRRVTRLKCLLTDRGEYETIPLIGSAPRSRQLDLVYFDQASSHEVVENGHRFGVAGPSAAMRRNGLSDYRSSEARPRVL
jgi:hypothetical protein